MATKTAKKVTLQDRVDQLKSNISEFHDDVLNTADKMVDISLESGAKWQKLTAKVLHKGTNLLEKQQDITFHALEQVKGQYQTGNKRFMKLLGLDQNKAKKAAKLQEKGRKNARKAVKTTKQVAATVTTKTQDSLQSLQGIGPKVESLLNNAGIQSFEALANASVENLRDILQNAGKRYQSMDPTPWKKLAKEAIAKGKKA